MCPVLKQLAKMSTSSSPCAACKLRRQKCAPECIFAPYFPPNQPKKFANVHEVFGASNVAKILNEISPNHREDAVNSLAYEAEARLRDPVYGCVGLISILQHRLKLVQQDLFNAKNELAKYIGPSAMLPIFDPGLIQLQQQHPCSNSGVVITHNMHQQQQMLGLPGPQYDDMLRETQQSSALGVGVVVVAREQTAEVVRYNGGFENAGGASHEVTTSGFSHMTSGAGDVSPPLLGLGSGSGSGSYDSSINYHQIQLQQQSEFHPQQLLLHNHDHPQQRPGSSEEETI